MYETEIAAKRTQAAEAIKAWQSKVAGTNGKPEEALSSDAQETIAKAKEAYFTLHSQLVNLETKAKESKEIEQHLALFNKPDKEFVLRTGEVQDVEPGEVFSEKGRFNRLRQVGLRAYLGAPKDGDPHYFASQVMTEKAKATPAEIHAMLPTQGNLGGFLLAPDYPSFMIENGSAQGIMRGLVRTFTTSRESVVLAAWRPPTGARLTQGYSAEYTGSWKKAGFVTGGTAPTVQNVNLDRKTYYVRNWVPDAMELERTLVEDSMFNLEEYVVGTMIQRTFDMDVDSAILTNGTGVDMPRGLLFNPGGTNEPAVVNSGSASLLTYNGLIDFITALPSWYSESPKTAMIMRKATLGLILQLKDDVARPIFNQALAGQLIEMLLGAKVRYSEFMAAVAANAFPIIIGDFGQYYWVERAGLVVLRDASRYFPNIAIMPWARNAGDIAVSDAFRIHKIAA